MLRKTKDATSLAKVMGVNQHHIPKTTMERVSIIFHLTTGPISPKLTTFELQLQETQCRCIYKTLLESTLFEYSFKYSVVSDQDFAFHRKTFFQECFLNITT